MGICPARAHLGPHSSLFSLGSPEGKGLGEGSVAEGVPRKPGKEVGQGKEDALLSGRCRG